MEQHSERFAGVPCALRDGHSNYVYGQGKCSSNKGSAANSQNVQSNHMISDGYWRKQATFKRTISEKSSLMEYFLGTIRAGSTIKLQTSTETNGLKTCCEQDQYEYETSYTIYPAEWLIRLGFRYGVRLSFLSTSIQGWKNSLQPFCPVPDDALIFDFCIEGNISAVKRLMSGGHASVRDTDSQGWTPLHVSRPSKSKTAGCLSSTPK